MTKANNFASQKLRDLIIEILLADGAELPHFTAFDLSQLLISKMDANEAVKEYFAEAVPETQISPGYHSLYGIKELKKIHSKLPSLGLVVFGSEPNGAFIAADIQTGQIYVLSHEISYDDCITSAAVLAQTEQKFESLSAFFEDWKTKVLAERDKRLAFERASKLDPDATDELGYTKLMWQVELEDLDGARSEIKRGADIHHKNKNGETPLIRAAVMESPEILQFLIDQGADLNCRDKNGYTPLMMTAEYCTFDHDCLKILLKAGADANATDNVGKTAFDHVCAVHGTSAMKRLLKRYMQA